jgi:hypothetical protein
MFWFRNKKRSAKEIIEPVVGHLSVIEADEALDKAGIARAYLRVSPEAKPGSVLKASAPSLAGSMTNLGPVAPGRDVSLGIHLQLLPNGRQPIKLILEEPNGPVSEAETWLNVSNAGSLSEQTTRLLRGHGTPLFFVGPCDSTMYPYDAHTAWFDRPDAEQHVEELLAQSTITQDEAKHLREFVRNGFMVLEGVIDDKLMDQVNAEIDDAISKGFGGYQRGSSQRIEHLHMHYEGLRKLWLDKRHLRLVDLIFDARARPCQTLTYVCGSEQEAHQDTMHLTPFPAGYMCGTWIALQDVVPDSGELLVYPGSHREKRLRLADNGIAKVADDWSEFGRIVSPQWAEMLKRYEVFIYRPKKGTVLIWHENLLHGGSVRKEQALERRSIVIHSFADGAIGYYDSTGLNGSAVRREAMDA